MTDALDGLIDAHVGALRVQADDGAKAFAVGVANDALEFAATEVERRLPSLDHPTQQLIMDMIRGLKRARAQ